MKTDPLPEVQQLWKREQHYLQAILAEEQEKADMNAETQHRLPAIQKVQVHPPDITDDPTVLLVHLGMSGLRRNNVNVTRPLDVDERVTPGTMPVARPTVTTEPIVSVNSSDGDRPGTTTSASTPSAYALGATCEHERVNLSYGSAFTRETDLSRNAQTLFNCQGALPEYSFTADENRKSVGNISGELPTVNFYVPPFTWHMQILHAIKVKIETFKSIYHNVRRIKIIRLSYRSYTIMTKMWCDSYFYDGHEMPVTDDHELSRKLRDDEVEVECW